MDAMLTPYAAQLVPNTLSNLLGNADFREDIRFAPFLRAYVFEDAQKRPVAAVWCHQDKWMTTIASSGRRSDSAVL